MQNGYQGKTRSLVGDAKFESMVRRESRKNILQDNTPAVVEEEEDEEAKEDEVSLMESLQDEAANSKVSFKSSKNLKQKFSILLGEADYSDKVK